MKIKKFGMLASSFNIIRIAAMVFKPGQSGNPSGGRGRKPIIDAVNSLVTLPWDGKKEVDLGEIPEKLTIAHALAYKLVGGALRNDYEPGESLAYFKEICDRVYGKATDNNPLPSVTNITINLSPTNRFLENLAANGADSTICGDVSGGSLLPSALRTESEIL